VFALADMAHFFADKFTSLCGWRFSLSFLFAGAFQRFLFWHAPSVFTKIS
jgi:hypothetical protein